MPSSRTTWAAARWPPRWEPRAWAIATTSRRPPAAAAGRSAQQTHGRTVAVLLPLVPLFLRQETCAPGRAFIGNGLSGAMSTDFNPGSCPSKNLWLALSVACPKLGLTPKEAVAAAILNAAWAIGRAAACGSLEPGKRADVLVLNLGSVAEIPYWLGENPVRDVVIGGVVQVP